MKLNKDKLLAIVLRLLFILNVLVLFDINHLNIRTVFVFLYLSLVPGYLLLLMLKIRRVRFWEQLVFTIGLSVVFLMLYGLLLNWVLPAIGIARPLSLVPVLIGFDVLVILLVYRLKRERGGFSIKLDRPRLDIVNKILLAAPLAFPLFAVYGAVSLNNEGSNIFTLVLLGCIALYVVIITYYRKNLDQNVYPLSLLFIATSLLLMTSLRGWYVTGHDVQLEQLMIKLTKQDFIWDIRNYRDPYNAVLSITILPTIYSTFVDINDLYIYKILFQIIFSFSVVGIYLLFNKYTSKFISFLSTFFFMSFPIFINDLPMLNRQEIAFLFFVLTLLTIFNDSFDSGKKRLLFLVFGIGMVISHYSTTYIVIALMTFTYLISFVLRTNFLKSTSVLRRILNRLGRKERLILDDKRFYIKLWMVGSLIIITFLWNVSLTRTTEGLERLITLTFENMEKSFTTDLKSEGVLYNLFNWKKLDKQQLLNEYVQELEGQVVQNKNLYYDASLSGGYEISLVDDDILPTFSLGNSLSTPHFDASSLNFYIRQIIAKVSQIFIIIGLVILILNKSKDVSKVDPEYKIMVLVSVGLLVTFILLPFLSIEYGTLRLFQQALVILALPAVLGVFYVFGFLDEDITSYLGAFFFILFFLSLSGFFPQLTGGFHPQLHLNNKGNYYESLYTHKSEISSIEWLDKNRDKGEDIQSSFFAHSKMLSNSNLFSNKGILPVSVRKDAYVYLDKTNSVEHKSNIFFKGTNISYSYPIEFLRSNKDLIYSSSGSQIFK